MLKRLRDLLGAAGAQPDDKGESDANSLRVATAALLVEMARADFSEDGSERQEILRTLQAHFSLDLAGARELLQQAGENADRAVSLHEFTRLLHEQLEANDKLAIIEMLWRVALADAELDKHEDYLVRKIADLLYVPHTDLMRLKHRVLGELDGGE